MAAVWFNSIVTEVDMKYTRQQIERAKVQGSLALAGYMAYHAGLDKDSYGCHNGLNSTLLTDKAAYKAGWLKAAEAENYAKAAEALYAKNRGF